MSFVIALEYTPRCPQPGMPFTETSFVRRSVPFTFEIQDIGVALVDLWNFGWDDGPVGETLGPELSLERGRSHAERKRQIIATRIAPAVDELRQRGVQIFHCNHPQFFQHYPQWLVSTTDHERRALAATPDSSSSQPSGPPPSTPAWPPPAWVDHWREQHDELVWGMQVWGDRQGHEVYPKLAIPRLVAPHAGDRLVYGREQFHRLLTARRIRALFYMGFEADECVQFSGYGIANMQADGYVCTIVRDCTTTHEVAETVAGLWKTKLAIITIEARFGYSVTVDALLAAVRAEQGRA